MEVEATALPQGDPYEGLRDITIQVMALLRHNLQRHQAWRSMKPIMGGAPGIFDDIALFLRIIEIIGRPWEYFAHLRSVALDPVVHWVKEHIFNPLQAHLSWLKDSILGWWHGAINWIVNTINTLKDRFLDKWHSLTSWLIGHLTWLKDSILGWWHGAITWIVNTVNSLKDRFLDKWHSLTSWLIGHLTWLKDSILGWWQGAIDRIHAVISWIGTFLHNPLEGLRQVWDWFRQTWAGQLLASLVQGLTTFFNIVITALRQLWAQIQPRIMEAAERAITFARPYIEQWVGAFRTIPAMYLEWVARTAGTNLALTPSRALATAGSLYAMSIAAGATAMTLATALNIIPATNWVGAQQFAAFISEAAGFEPLTRATYGTLLNECLVWPLRYHWNMQLRPKIPTEGTIFLMGRKRGLDRSEFTQAMGYQGLPDWWIDKEYLFFWTDPSPYWLLRMSEHANPQIEPSDLFLPWLEKWLPNWRSDPWAWYKMKLMLAGFEDTDIPAFIAGFQARKIATSVTQVKTSVRAMLREAYWTRVMAEDALRPMGVRQDEIELLYLAEELDYQKGYLDDQVTYFKESFRKGEIDDQDLSLALSTIYVKPERVYQEVARERVRALPKPKSITEPKEDPRVKSLRTQAINSWTKAYRNWEIDEEDLLLGLTIVTQDRALAEELVNVERTRYRPLPLEPPLPPEAPEIAKVRREAIASWVSAYRKGEITADQLELYLEPLIPDPAMRREIVRIELLRYTPPPAVPPPAEEAPQAALARRQAIASWVTAFRKGEITTAELELYLEPLIPDAETRRQVVLLEQLRYLPTPELIPPVSEEEALAKLRQEYVRGHIEMFQKREIALEELYSNLLADGLVEPLARATVITQASKRLKVPALDSPYFLQDVIRGLIDQGLTAFEEMYMAQQITLAQYTAWLTEMGVDGDVITYLADTLTLRRFLERL